MVYVGMGIAYEMKSCEQNMLLAIRYHLNYRGECLVGIFSKRRRDSRRNVAFFVKVELNSVVGASREEIVVYKVLIGMLNNVCNQQITLRCAFCHDVLEVFERRGRW